MAFMFKITIDNTKVPGADKVNFPFRFSYLASTIPVGFWTSIIDAGALDVRFYGDAGKTVELKREIDFYDSVLDKIEAWVQIPLCKGTDTGTDTEIFCEAGGATKGNDTEIWDDLGCANVQHFQDDGIDSTDEGNNANPDGTFVYQNGKIGKGIEFDGTTGHAYLDENIAFDQDMIAEAWIYMNDYPPFVPSPDWDRATIISRSLFCTPQYRGNGQFIFCVGYNGLLSLRVQETGSCTSGQKADKYETVVAIPLTTWTHVAVVSIDNFDHDREVAIFINGVQVTYVKSAPVDFIPAIDVDDRTQYGASWIGAGGMGLKWFFNGIIDEARVYRQASYLWDADWWKAVYNSQNDPDSFFSSESVIGDPIPFDLFMRITPFGLVAKDDGEIDMFITSSLGWFEGDLLPDTIITDHAARARDLLIEQFEEAVNLKALLTIYVDEIQEIEYVISEVIRTKNLEVATGAQLDILGERVGESRDFKNDEDYRAAIQFRIFLNSSNGEPETVIAALRILGKTDYVAYSEPAPATIMLVFSSLFIPPSNLKQQLEQIALAGVKILLGMVLSDDLFFGFGTEGGVPAPPTTGGFGELNNPGGGQFVEYLT